MRRPLLVALVAVATISGGCGDAGKDSPATTTTTAERSAAEPSLPIVALGDSETTGDGDDTGRGWVGRYAQLLRARLGLTVQVKNLAQNGKTSEELLDELRNDPGTRDAVKNAQVVLLGVGGADLNAGDDRLAAGKCRAETCYAPVLRSFARNYDGIVAEVRELRGANNTVLRSITQPNALTGAEDVIPPFLRNLSTRIGVYQARTANRAICRVMAEYGGRCIDVLRRFNGPGGTRDAYRQGLLNLEDCCYPSAKGQQVMAQMLFETGLAPVR
jgi:lysophospholipase L1-like esterase